MEFAPFFGVTDTITVGTFLNDELELNEGHVNATNGVRTNPFSIADIIGMRIISRLQAQ